MATTPPSISVSRVPGQSTQIAVSWGASSPQFPGRTVSYRLERSTNGGSYAIVISSTTARSTTRTELAGNFYRYRVAALESGVNNSAYRVSDSITLPPAAPSVLSLSRVSGDFSAILISYSKSNGADSYEIERKVGSGSFQPRFARPDSALSQVTDTGLSRGSTYTYRIKAVNNGGSSAFKESDSLTLFTVSPSSVTATKASNNSIRVQWPASSGATSYDVDIRQDGGSYSRTTSGNTSRDITYTLIQGPTYQFRVFSRNSAGQSPGSTESGSVFLPPPPPRPSSATATKTKRDVRITFPASTPPAGTTIIEYQIEIRENNGSFGSRKIDNGSGETYLNLNPGSTYRGRVRAVGQGGESDWRETGDVTISSPPTTPANILLTRSARNVFVDLGISTAASDVTISGYTIQRRESFNGGATWGAWGDQRSLTTTDRTTTYTNLVAETTQQFRGRAESDFNASDWRTSAPLFIPGIPDAPSQVFALREGAAVFVIVAAPARTGGVPILTYTIQKRISEDLGQTWSEWGESLVIPFSDSFYRYENLELQKTYQVRALATNSEGNSETFTQSNTVYLPAIMKIYDNGQFRLPFNYKRYSQDVGDWIGLSISKRYLNGQWIDLE